MGKPSGHVPSTNTCEDCHRTSAWTPATSFDHSSVTPGTCLTCHNGTTAKGQPSGHFGTSLSCDECHTTSSFFTTRYIHSTPGLTHNSSVTCTSCHTTNNTTITYENPEYRPNCASCHADTYLRKMSEHKKTKTPETSYPVSELQDCTGSCHIYTDSTLTTIETRRDGRHSAGRGDW
jgi:hypothetical protein